MFTRRIIGSKDEQSYTGYLELDQHPAYNADAGSSEEILKTTDSYSDRMLKHLPVEVTGAYLFLDNLIKADANNPNSLMYFWVVFILLIVLTPIYTWRITKKPELNRVPVFQIIMAPLSFTIWVYAIGGPFSYHDWYSPLLASILLVIYSLILGLFRDS